MSKLCRMEGLVGEACDPRSTKRDRTRRRLQRARNKGRQGLRPQRDRCETRVATPGPPNHFPSTRRRRAPRVGLLARRSHRRGGRKKSRRGFWRRPGPAAQCLKQRSRTRAQQRDRLLRQQRGRRIEPDRCPSPRSLWSPRRSLDCVLRARSRGRRHLAP